MRAVARAVEALRRTMSIVETKVSKTKTVTEAGIRRWVEHGRGMVKAVKCLHIRGIVCRGNVR